MGPTAEGDLNGRLPTLPTPSDRAAIESLFDRVRTAVGVEKLPEGSVSFFERLGEDDEEYHLRYNLLPVGNAGRDERLIGQVEVGKILTLTRRLPSESANNEPDGRDRLSAEVTRSQKLKSGATVKTETNWSGGQLGPVELGAIEAFFVPAVELFEREGGKE